MSAIDYIFLVALITGAVYGFIKGSISQVAGLFSIYAGLVLASAFSDVVSKWLAPYLGLDPRGLHILAFILVLILSIFLISILARIVTRIFEATSLGLVNRLLGALIGLFITALVLSVVLLGFEKFNDVVKLVEPETLSQSRMYMPIKGFLSVVTPFLEGFLF